MFFYAVSRITGRKSSRIYENPDHGHSPLYEVERGWGRVNHEQYIRYCKDVYKEESPLWEGETKPPA